MLPSHSAAAQLSRAVPKSPSDAAPWRILRSSLLNVLQTGPVIVFSIPTSCSNHSLRDVFLCLHSPSQGRDLLAEAQQLPGSHPCYPLSFILSVHRQVLLLQPASHFSAMPCSSPLWPPGFRIPTWFLFFLFACKPNHNFQCVNHLTALLYSLKSMSKFLARTLVVCFLPDSPIASPLPSWFIILNYTSQSCTVTKIAALESERYGIEFQLCSFQSVNPQVPQCTHL